MANFKLKDKNSCRQIINYKKAFTLIELMVVMAIISLLTSVVLSSLADSRMKANDTKIVQDLSQFKIAVGLYYNDNHFFPPKPVAVNDNQNANAFADNSSQDVNESSKNGWANKLSFFVKTAEAQTAPSHNITLLCRNFDKIAGELVTGKYLSSIPVHPYDNDATGVCYKAVNATSSFSVYTILTKHVGVSSNGSTAEISKRTGFIMGDMSPSGINNLNSVTESVSSTEIPYPSNYNVTPALDVNTSIDGVLDVTVGAPVISGGSGGGFFAPVVNLISGITNPTSPVEPSPLGTGSLLGPGDGTIHFVGANCPPGANVILGQICQMPPVGCDSASLLNGTCTGTSTYVCPIGKTYVLDGRENTIYGVCI